MVIVGSVVVQHIPQFHESVVSSKTELSDEKVYKLLENVETAYVIDSCGVFSWINVKSFYIVAGG